MTRSKRTTQHRAVLAARAVGIALIVVPTIGAAAAAADTGASPTPGPAELAAAQRALADANTPWVALDQTTDPIFNPIHRDWTVNSQSTPVPVVTGQRRAPVTPPTARRAVEHHTAPPAPRRAKAPTTRRQGGPRVAGQRQWRPSGVCRTRDGVWLVGPGDTLSQIAACTRTSVERLAARNGISDPDRIRVGQHLVIPAAPR